MNTEVDIDIIQNQIQNCEDIVNNIDTIVPKLYKIRQQALSQKNYANDVIGLLLNSMSGVDNSKVINILPTISFDNDVNTNNLTTSFVKTSNTVDSRKIIHSLFKFKHDLGTSKHFTTEQIGAELNRTQGSNLIDVKNFTNGMNKLLELDATTGLAASNTNLNLDKLLLEPYNSNNIDYNITLSGTSVVSNTTSGSLEDNRIIVGFGLN